MSPPNTLCFLFFVLINPGGETFDRSDILLAGGVVQSIEKSVYFAVISENLHKTSSIIETQWQVLP
jgi:hypothetical protein